MIFKSLPKTSAGEGDEHQIFPWMSFPCSSESHYKLAPNSLPTNRSASRADEGVKDSMEAYVRWQIDPSTFLWTLGRRRFRVILLGLNCFACCRFLFVLPQIRRKGPGECQSSQFKCASCLRGLIGCLVIQFSSRTLFKQMLSDLIAGPGENGIRLWGSLSR